MALKFEAWLNDQQTRDDEIGALARLPKMQGLENKESKRAFDEHREWVNIVLGIPDGRNVFVFNDAWKEFLVARKAANDTTG